MGARATDDTLPISASEATDPPPRQGDLLPGSAIDRYVVLRTLGRGGMGVVYAAYDEALDRRVAIKLLASDSGAHLQGAEARLLREAQAMAKLAHPNVAFVLEVGTFGAQVYLAMEYVDGVTLRAWRSAKPRSVREIVATYVQAGRGLEAAHVAGILHRDFKPENAIVDAGGRVRVLDFGLARIDEPMPSEDGDDRLEATASMRTPNVPLTRWGALLGTPGYMAPEQLRGEWADAQSDQFGFAVSLFEALYGVRPFEGNTLGEVLDAIQSERITPPPAGTHVPRALRGAIVRALRAKPADRYPSMRELLRAIEAAAQSRAKDAWIVGGVAIGAALAVVAAFRPAHAPVCGDSEQEIATTWGAPQKAAVTRAFSAIEGPRAADALDRVKATLDAYASRWAKMRTDACEATHVRGAQSDEALDLRTSCLDERRAELAATVALFSKVDAARVEDSVATAHALGDLGTCADVAALRAPYAASHDPAQRRAADLLRAKLADATVLVNARENAEAAAPLEAIAREAKAIDNRPIEAEALLLLAKTQAAAGRAEDAKKSAYDAALEANTVRDDVTEAKAWTTLASIAGYDLGHFEQGDLFADLAGRAIDRAGSPDALAAPLLYARALPLRAHGHAAEAETLLREALDVSIRAFGEVSLDAAQVERQLGDIEVDQWRIRDGVASYQQALGAEIALLGEQNSRVGLTLAKLALAYELLGDANALTRTAKRSMAAAREDDRYHASARRMLAEADAYAGDLDGAQREGRGAFDELARHYGSSWQVQVAHVALDSALVRRHFDAAALIDLDPAVAALASQPSVGLPGRCYQALAGSRAHRAGALANATEVLALCEANHDQTRGDLVVPLLALGEAALASNDPARAVAALERAAASVDALEGVPELHADVHLALARALDASHGDLVRARDLSGRAAREYDATRLPDLAASSRALEARLALR